jgi:hypothetical protein
LSRLTAAELDRLLASVQQKCDRTTISYLQRVLAENEELRTQAAERQHMYDIEPET